MRSSLFTIVIPTYRRPFLLQKAINSALKQTYTNITVLVLDNASGDETQEIVLELQKQDPRLEYISHSKNIGMLGQYQFGIDHVKTEFFSFLSDDDLLLPSFCKTSIQGLEEFPDCCLFASSSIIYSKEKGILRVPLDLWPHEGRYNAIIAAHTMVGKYPVPTTIAFRKSFLSTVFIDHENPIAWDCDFLLQLASRFPIAISKKVTGIFFNHPTSLTASLSYEPVLDSIRRMIERAPIIDFASSSKLSHLLNQNLLEVMKGFAKFSGANGQIDRGYNIAKSLISFRPISINTAFIFIAIAILKMFPFLNMFIPLIKRIRKYYRKEVFQQYKEYVNEIS